MSRAYRRACGVFAGLIALAFFTITAAVGQNAEVARYERYESAVRAAALQLRVRQAECRMDPATQALCTARADTQWRTAMALAKASYVGTREAWGAAEAEIKAAAARLTTVEAAIRKP